MDDILFVKADGNYCDLYLTTQTAYNTVRIQIGQLWSKIKDLQPVPVNVQRVGRSHIINLDYLQFADPQKRTITLFKDKAVVLDNVARDVIKELLKVLSQQRRKEVLAPYLVQMQLSVPVENLNDEQMFENGHEYVDLGLTSGTLWSTRNVGGNTVNDFYYGWGELYPSDSYSKAEYIHRGSKVEGKHQMRLSDDVAHICWGGNWRTPTKEQFEELTRECIVKWCWTQHGQKGFLCTGPNGNRIFLKADGYVEDSQTRPTRKNQEAKFWTSDLAGDKYGGTAYSYLLAECDDVECDVVSVLTEEKCWMGLSVRPVLSSPSEIKTEERKNTLLVLDDFDDLLDDWNFFETDSLPGWRVVWPLLPREPREALQVLQKWCEKYQPDAIIGLGKAALYAHQLPARNILLFNPIFNPAEELDLERSLYEEDEMDTSEIEKRKEDFEQICEHQFGKASEKKDCCWGFFLYAYDDKNCEVFDEHFDSRKIFDMPVLKSNRYWECYYAPLVLMIDAGEYPNHDKIISLNLQPYAKKMFYEWSENNAEG